MHCGRCAWTQSPTKRCSVPRCCFVSGPSCTLVATPCQNNCRLNCLCYTEWQRVLVLEGFVQPHSLLIPTPGSLVFGALIMQGCFVIYLAVAGREGPRQADAASSCRRHTRSRNLSLVSTAVCRRSRRHRFSVRRCESSSRSSLDRDPTVARAIAAARAACMRRPARQPRGCP